MKQQKHENGDVIINMNQSNANLIKVLFERTSRLTDSATYDITAWSLPFVYGIKTYGLNAYVTSGTFRQSQWFVLPNRSLRLLWLMPSNGQA